MDKTANKISRTAPSNVNYIPLIKDKLKSLAKRIYVKENKELKHIPDYHSLSLEEQLLWKFEAKIDIIKYQYYEPDYDFVKWLLTRSKLQKDYYMNINRKN